MRFLIFSATFLFIFLLAQAQEKSQAITEENAEDVELLFHLEFNEFVSGVKWSPSSQYLGILLTRPNMTGDVIIWDVTQQNEFLVLSENIRAFEWSSTGDFFASISIEDFSIGNPPYNVTVVIRDTTTWNVVYTLNIPNATNGWCCHLAWSPNQDYLAANMGSALVIWQFTDSPSLNLSLYWQILNDEAFLTPLSWSHTSQYLAGYRPTAYTEDYKVLIKILDVVNKTTAYEIKESTTTTWAPHSNLLAIIDWNRLRILDMESQADTIEVDPFPGFPHDLAWSPDGSLIAVPISAHGDDWSVRIVDTATGEELAQLLGHSTSVEFASWSPDGTKIASSDRNGRVIIWGVP